MLGRLLGAAAATFLPIAIDALSNRNRGNRAETHREHKRCEHDTYQNSDNYSRRESSRPELVVNVDGVELKGSRGGITQLLQRLGLGTPNNNVRYMPSSTIYNPPRTGLTSYSIQSPLTNPVNQKDASPQTIHLIIENNNVIMA